MGAFQQNSNRRCRRELLYEARDAPQLRALAGWLTADEITVREHCQRDQRYRIS
jgi:hypothetical protein